MLGLLQSILQLVFFSLCFIFSTQMEKCTGQSGSHLDPSGPQRGVTQLPPTAGLASERHPNPSCLPVYLLLLSQAKILGISFIIRFHGGKEKGSLVRTEVNSGETGVGEAETLLGDQPDPDQGALPHW